MLIYIDNTIAEYLRQNKLNDNQQNFFGALALSHQKGRCMVFGQIDSLNALIDCFGSPINGIYKTILSKYSECGSVARWTSSVLVVSCDGVRTASSLPSILKNKAQYWSINEAASINWGLGSCLLGENINDCEFYVSIGKYYSKKNKIRNVRIAFHYEQGGGSTIASILRKCVVQDALLTLCIADTDIKYGSTDEHDESPKGSTFLTCEDTGKKLIREGYQNRFCLKHNLVHEIENLVPLEFLKILGNEICFEEGLKILVELERIDNGTPILYYDFKKGENLDISTPHGQYWEHVFSQTPVHRDDNQYESVICEHFLERVNEYISKNGLVRISLNPYLSGIWDELGQIVFTWGCASCPIRA